MGTRPLSWLSLVSQMIRVSNSEMVCPVFFNVCRSSRSQICLKNPDAITLHWLGVWAAKEIGFDRHPDSNGGQELMLSEFCSVRRGQMWEWICIVNHPALDSSTLGALGHRPRPWYFLQVWHIWTWLLAHGRETLGIRDGLSVQAERLLKMWK